MSVFRTKLWVMNTLACRQLLFLNVCFTFDSYLPQFIDHANNIGGQWNRFNNGITTESKCPAKSISIKAFFVCIIGLLVFFVSVNGSYRERVLSFISSFKEDAISAFDLGATVHTYSTLSCNTDKKNELQCLVHMHPEISETRNCYTSHGTVNHSFCGRRCK